MTNCLQPAIEHIGEPPRGAGLSRRWLRTERMKAEIERIMRAPVGDWREVVQELQEAVCYAEMEMAEQSA